MFIKALHNGLKSGSKPKMDGQIVVYPYNNRYSTDTQSDMKSQKHY